ncbi:hypothetical protein AKJ16_DCAP07050 [Drosera capensis]
MGSEEDESSAQKLKRAAAAAYDYENDSRWAEYWANILIPPHMASRSDVVDHFKRKFYQRYIDPGLVVEPMSMGGSTQSPRQAATSSSPSRPASDQPRSRPSVSSTRTSAPSGPAAGSSPTLMRWDRQTIQFSINAWVLALALLSVLPIVPKHLSNRAYKLSFLGTTCSSLYSLYTLYGLPRAWNLQGAQAWLQSVVATKDFIYFFYSLMFATSHVSLKFALIPISCRAVELVAKFLRRNSNSSTLYRKYLEEPCVWVESNTPTLSILSSNAEVGLGFLQIISLLSLLLPCADRWQRNIIQTFMYWQLLKLMYHAPVTAGYHQSVWSKIGRSVNPSIQRYAPFLNTPLTFIQRWWFR